MERHPVARNLDAAHSGNKSDGVPPFRVLFREGRALLGCFRPFRSDDPPIISSLRNRADSEGADWGMKGKRRFQERLEVWALGGNVAP